MAITVTQDAFPNDNGGVISGDYGKSQTPAIYVVSSNQTGQPNFKYFVKIYQDSPAGTLLATYYIPANPSGDLVFDASSVFNSDLRPDTDTNGGTNSVIHDPSNYFTRGTDSCRVYTVRFGEYYGNPPSEQLSTDETPFIFWGKTLSKELRNTNYLTMLGYSSSNPEEKFPFLTERYRGIWHPYDEGENLNLVNPIAYDATNDTVQVNALSTDKGVLSFLCASVFIKGADILTGTSLDGVEYKFYDSSDTLLGTEYEALNTTNGGHNPNLVNDGNYMLHIAAYPANDQIAAFLTTYSTTAYYTIQLVEQDDPTNVPLCKWFRVNIVGSISCKNTPLRLGWVNRFAGWDYEWFDGRAVPTFNKESKKYRKLRGDYSGTSFDYDTWDGGETVYHTDVEKTWKIRKTITTPAERLFLESLFESEVVHLFDGDLVVPVTVENRTYTAEPQASKVYTIEFEIKEANYVNA